MKKDIQTAAQKRPYMMPQMLSVVISHTQMLAASGDPEVHTSNDKASTDYQALTKESSSSIWDNEW
jgi:hypothetical protein